MHLASVGQSYAQIAKQVKCSLKTVSFWVSRFKKSGSTDSISASGRPPLLDSDARKKAVDLLIEGCDGGARFVAKKLNSDGLTRTVVAPGTVLRAAKAQALEDGNPLICRRGRPPKSLSGATKSKRVQFAKTNKNRSWARVMFTDRCKFHFRYPGCVVRGTRWLKSSDKHLDGAPLATKASVYNVYGGVTRYGTTRLHEVSGSTGLKTSFMNKKGGAARNITQAEYSHVLGKTLLKEGQRIFSQQGMSAWVLQQDNDPAHAKAAAIVTKHNDKQRGSRVELLQGWPGNSPDLSPIENVWAYVDAEVAKKGCQTFAEFKAAVNLTFEALPLVMCQNLIASVPKRLKKCVEFDGAKCGY